MTEPKLAITGTFGTTSSAQTAGDILYKAIDIVSGDRSRTHGDIASNMKIISDLWSVYLDKSITPQDVSMMMILLKVARLKTGTPITDHFVDIAGYAGIGGQVSGEIR